MSGLFERGREFQELDAQIARAAAGQGCVVVVEGPAGIGKSRLVAEARGRADATMRVLSARGSELEGEFAFGVVRQLFEAELAERREALLAGAAAPAAAVFGELEGGASFAVLHGLYWLVLNLAEEGPLLLAVDDLHWCDRPSLLFLAYLAGRLERQPVLLLTGLREAEPGTDPALLGEIVHDATSIRPAPLSEAAVAAVVEERLGVTPTDRFVAACHDATGGNPLLLSQLVTALRGEGVRPDDAHVATVTDIGPRAVSRTVLLRLARLPEDARAVASAVAVLGEGAGLSAVADLAGVEQTRLADATRRLAQAEILRPELPLAFVHPLVRDAVYHDLAPAERELRHARAAALLRDAGAPTEHVAAQLLHTAPHGERWAVELLREAGRAAVQAGAADSAVAYLRRALDEGPADAELLFELGAVEAQTSGPAAAEHLALAYEQLSDPAARAAAAGLLGRALLFTGAPEEAAAVARRAAAELPDELADLRMGLEALEYMTMYFGAGDPQRQARLREHRRRPPGGWVGPGSRMLAAMASWQAVCSDGVAEECAAVALAALEGGSLVAADPALIPFAAIVTLVVTDRPEVPEIWSRVLADAHRGGSLLSASSTHLWHGFSHLRRGDLAAAEELLRADEHELMLWGHAIAATVLCRCFLADVLYERGRLDEASRLLAQVGTIDPGQNTTGWWLTTRTALLTATGRAQEGAAVADELAAHCAAVSHPARLWWRSLKAEALDRLDRQEEAIALATEELAVTRAFGAPWSLGRTLRVLGTLERDEGRLREAVAVLEGSTARLEHAKALAALGSARRLARRPTEAREPLRRALDLAGACGAQGLADHVRSELYAAGSRPRRDALSGVESLTPSERRVVDLATAGHTNRDIAQELYVTPKTVEVHLSSAYRKLGISSRRELDRALAAD